MRKQNRRCTQKNKCRWPVRLLTMLAALLIASALLDLRLRPVVETVLRHQAQNAAICLLNAVTAQELEENNTTYSDLVQLTYAADGTVRSIETNVLAVNRLKARIAAQAAKALEDPKNQTLSIPLGTLLDSHFISGLGPGISVQLFSVGSVNSSLTHQFESAGVNQTLHRIALDTTIQLTAILPGYTVQTSCTSSFCIAETVIVGTVPERYAAIGDASS